MYHSIIIGKGPAGLQAAVYLARASLSVLLIGTEDGGSLEKAEQIDNYFGFPDSISGTQLLQNGIRQAERFGAQLVTGEVLGLEMQAPQANTPAGFDVVTSSQHYQGQTILLATGKPLPQPAIPGIQEFAGHGVSYCATCDGFFYRNKEVAILGNQDYAVHEAEELSNFTKNVTICTNGQELIISREMKQRAQAFPIIRTPIQALQGQEVLEQLLFADGSRKAIAGLFVALARPSALDFAKRLGLAFQDGMVITDSAMRTNIDGIYAAGDCAASFRQIAVAVGQGAMAAQSILSYCKGQR